MPKHKIKRFNVMQTAKVGAVLYFFVSLIVLLPMSLLLETIGTAAERPFPGGGGAIMLILMPLLYAILGFIGTAIGCGIYNIVAGWVGGIEIEVEVED